MTLRAILAALLSLCLLACGVKSDLMQPGVTQPDKRQTDPSKPPQPLGQ